MNFNTLTPTAKMLKKLQNYATGQPVTPGDVPIITIINAGEVIESKRLVEEIIFGVKSAGGAAFMHNVAVFGYSNKINPATAKYADSFARVAAANAEAIVKSNMADGAVIVTDCDITAAGLLRGCHNANCPVLVLPLGQITNYSVQITNKVLTTAGKVTSGTITSIESEDILKKEFQPKITSSLFALLENIGFCTEGASVNRRGSGAQLAAAGETGKRIVGMAKDLTAPKKLLTKTACQNVVDFCLTSGGSLSALSLLGKLFNANDVKVAPEFIAERASKITPKPRVVRVSGSMCAGHVQYGDTTPATFHGKAWVYATLEDADRALLSGSIPAGSVVVLQNCVGMNVTAFAYAIEGMGREKDIAIATDGVCDHTGVLAVTLCTPDSGANEEFANIQNGDALEIDINRGRFNTSVLAKDQKVRAKKNTTKKQAVYF